MLVLANGILAGAELAILSAEEADPEEQHPPV